MSFVQVQEFNDTFGVRTRDDANVRVREAKLRFELIREEFEELNDAYKLVDVVEFADAFGDIIYVVIGAAQVFGIASETIDHFETNTEKYDGQLLNAEVQKEILQLLRLAILQNDAPTTAVVLATILRLVADAAEFFRIDIDPIVTAIHKSNMSKLAADGSVIRRESDNKVLKGENYKTPTADIERLLGFDDVDSE